MITFLTHSYTVKKLQNWFLVILLIVAFCFNSKAQTSASYSFNTAGEINSYFNRNNISPTITQTTNTGINGTGAINLSGTGGVNAVFVAKQGFAPGAVGSIYSASTYFQSVGNFGHGGFGITANPLAAYNSFASPGDGIGISVHGGGYIFNNDRNYNTLGNWTSSINDLLNNGSPSKWYKIVLTITRKPANVFDVTAQVFSANSNGSLIRVAPDATQSASFTNASMGSATTFYSYFAFGGYRITNFDEYSTTLIGTTFNRAITTGGNLNAFNSCTGSASPEQSVSVSGIGLTDNLILTSPTGYEISTTSGAGFTNSISLTPTSGIVNSTPIFIRLTNSATGAPSGNITCTSTGATANTIALSGTVNPLPTINLGAVSNIIPSSTSFSLPYSAATGSPNQYSITTGSPSAMGGFSAVSNATLGASPISVTIPASMVNTYNFIATVRNSTTGCVSANTAFTVQVSAVVSSLSTIGTLSAFSTCIGTASTEQSFMVSGTGLTNNLIVTPPTGYEVSITSGTGFASTVSITPSSGTVSSTNIYVRLTNAATGTPSGNIAVTSTGATTQNVAASGTVTAANTVGAASSSPTLCINTALTNITHTTTGATGIGTATGLPAGVTAAFASNTITISGTPTSAGTFNYSIPLTGGCSSVNATGTITVTAANTAGAASSTPTLCINTALTNITHTTTGATGIGTATGLPTGVTAAWASNTITISGTPTAAGIFNYSIPLTGGCSSVNATGTITVSAANTVGIASSTPTLCINTALTNITHTTTGTTGIGTATGLPTGVTAAWASNTITISGTPTAAGIFNYSIPLTGGCSSVNATGTITVSALPTVSDITGTQQVCVSSTILFASTTTGGLWSSNNTAIATISSTGLITGIASGVASIRYTVTNVSGCVNFVTRDITVNALPALTPITGAATICQSNTTTFSNSTSGGVWSSVNTTIATITNTGNLFGVTSGVTAINYVVTNANNCSITNTRSITVLSQPARTPILKDVLICKATSFIVDATVPSTSTYAWTSSTGGFTSILPTVSVTNPALYRVTITLQNGCFYLDSINLRNTLDTAIRAKLLVTAQAYLNDNVVAVNLTTPAPQTAVWNIPIGAQVVSQSNNNLILRFATTGRYQIGLNTTSLNVCSSRDSGIVIISNKDSAVSNTSNSVLLREVNVGPNPSSGIFNFIIKLNKQGKVSIRIFDINGVLAYSTVIPEASGISVINKTVDISSSLRNTYVAVVQTDGSYEQRILIKN